MKKDLKRSWSGRDWLAVVFFVIVAAYIYVGFYFPAPSVFFQQDILEKFLNLIRFFFPLAVAGAIYLFFCFRTGKISRGAMRSILIACLFLFLLISLVSDLAYDHFKDQRVEKFHSYLQLAPALIKDYRAGRFNVVCLGGSTTEFKDELGRDWPTMVEKALKDRYQFQDIKFYNLGKQWYSSQHILIHYIQNVRKYRPQVVIVMENVNDLLHNADFSPFSTGGFREDYGNFFGPMTRVVKYGSFSSYFSHELKNIWYQKAPVEVVTEQFLGLESYERNIRTLITLARADGTMVILMTQPNMYKDTMLPEELRALYMLNTEAVGNGKKWAYRTALAGFRQYNDKLREIAASEKAPLIDLEKVIPKNLKYFGDDVHYKKPAYELIADVLSERLSKILPRDKP